MPRKSVERSRLLGPELRRRRLEMGLTLQDIVDETKKTGRPIPYSTVAKIETGEVDPGILRFHQLLKIYQLPVQAVQDLLDLEEVAEEFDGEGVDTETLVADGRAHLEKGDMRGAMARFLVARQRKDDPWEIRAKAALGFTGVCCAVGKYRLALTGLEEVIVDPPDARILVTAYIQAAICWDGLGSPDAALGFLERGEAHMPRGDARVRAWLYHKKATVLCALGRVDEARRDLSRARSAYRAAGDRFGATQLLALRIRIELESGRAEASLGIARRARAVARKHGFARLEMQRGIDEAIALLALGQAEAAAPMLEAMQAKALAMQDRNSQFLCHHHLARAYHELGLWTRARSERDAARYFVRFVDESTPETRVYRGEVGDASSKS